MGVIEMLKDRARQEGRAMMKKELAKELANERALMEEELAKELAKERALMEEERAKELAKERALMEEERAKELALMEGERAKGLADEKYKITQNLLTQANMPIPSIASIVGVSEYFVRKVKRELNSEPAVG